MREPSFQNDEARRSRTLPAPDACNPDAAAGECLDRITRLAAQALDMPVALFSLGGGATHRLAAHAGATPAQAARYARYARCCADAILADGVTVVEDIHADPCLAALAMAEEGPGIRFCAAVPVHGPDGHCAGTLCVLDHRPRHFDDSRRLMLADFALLLERELAATALQHSFLEQQDSEKAARALFDHMPEGVMMLSDTGVILSCNIVAEAMYGATKNGLLGRHTNDFVGEDPARLGEAFRAGKTDQVEAIARRVDGSVFPAEFSIKTLDTSGPFRYALAVRDISARKEAELKAQAADARRRTYFVTATHELRTPMASVLGFSELLLKNDFEADERREITDIVHRQATRLVNLINEMLDLARIASGGSNEFDIRPQDSGVMLEQALRAPEVLHASSRIRTRLAPDLPRVLADSARLRQALANIIRNALTYSDADSQIQVEVFKTDVDANPMIGFRVIDQGTGMTPEQQARMFDPFYRAQGEPDMTGTGLGMTICKEIVDAHGGRIEIDSSPRAGTTLVLLLPAATEGNSPSPADDR